MLLQLTGKIPALRIGVVKEGFGHPDSESDVDDLVRKCAQRLGATAAFVEDVSIPWHLDGKRTYVKDVFKISFYLL